MRRVEYVPWQADRVAGAFERLDDLVEKFSLRTYSQAFHVLKDERFGIKLRHDADEFEHQFVSGVLQGPVTNQRESLARRAADYAINGASSDPNRPPNLFGRQAIDRTGDYRGRWKVELMDGTMHWIDLHCGRNVEAFETETQAPGFSEKVNGDRPEPSGFEYITHLLSYHPPLSTEEEPQCGQ